MADGTTFYRWRGTVARIVRDAAGTSVAIYDRSADRWVDFPGIYGKLTGLGGDGPLPTNSRDQARAIIDATPGRRFVLDDDPPDGHYP